RAFGSNRTKAPRMRAGAGASMIGSCQTVPVNDCAGARREGVAPNGLISMASSPALAERPARWRASTDRAAPEDRGLATEPAHAPPAAKPAPRDRAAIR